MKRNTLFKTALALCTGALLMAAGESQAVIINSANGYVLGFAPGSPSGPANSLGRLEELVDEYNGVPPAGMPAGFGLTPGTEVPPPTIADPTSTTGDLGGGVTSFNLDVTGYSYLHVKWANESYYYYIGGLSGTHTVDNDVVFNSRGRPQEASHYNLYGPEGGGDTVPEGGASVVLLGLALAGLGATSRFVKKA